MIYTPFQEKILVLLVAGYTNKKIAERLGYTVATILSNFRDAIFILHSMIYWYMNVLTPSIIYDNIVLWNLRLHKSK